MLLLSKGRNGGDLPSFARSSAPGFPFPAGRVIEPIHDAPTRTKVADPLLAGARFADHRRARTRRRAFTRPGVKRFPFPASPT